MDETKGIYKIRGFKEIMDCDLCNERGLHEVFILRERKFARNATKRERKASRVCWGCARSLFFRRVYNFGTNWRNIFVEGHIINKRNSEKYAKYMVIHA